MVLGCGRVSGRRVRSGMFRHVHFVVPVLFLLGNGPRNTTWNKVSLIDLLFSHARSVFAHALSRLGLDSDYRETPYIKRWSLVMVIADRFPRVSDRYSPSHSDILGG